MFSWDWVLAAPVSRSQVRSDSAERLLSVAGLLCRLAASRRFAPAYIQSKARLPAALQAWLHKTEAIRKKLQELEAPVKAKAEQEIVTKFNDDLQGLLKKPAQQCDPLEKQIAALAYRQIEYEFERIDKKFKGEQEGSLSQAHAGVSEIRCRQAKPATGDDSFRYRLGSPPLYIPKKQQLGPVAQDPYGAG